MPEYNINKGVGKPVEFQGLQAQYIFYLVGGLLGNFFVFAILYVIGIPSLIGVVYFIFSSVFIIYYVFSMGKKHGQYGLKKLNAKIAQPKYIVSRDPKLFQNLKKSKP